ncbi:MAG: phosphotransferase, partial [Desulfobacterales bacterium]|nr:phosphotransferase [Desulfobacterales bacterium]
PLCGDGSDRKWYRALHGSRSVIVGDHGICTPGSDRHKELLAFINIGNHLKQTGLNVPVIYGYDLLSGIVTLEDLGDVHLQSVVNQTQDETLTLALYKNVIDHLIDFSENAKTGFNPDWACQTPAYSKDVIIEKECRYFIQAFVKNYLNRRVDANALTDEFEWLADRILESGRPGLMHRDCQSRNIMIKDNQPYFIDFQSARLGPVQYDLASLLIDPYVNLNSGIQQQLLEYAMKRLASDKKNEKNFLKGYHYCCITRNLQILGAFGFLTVEKNKPGFERYIPVALKRLKQNLRTAPDRLHKLSGLVQAL